MHFSTGNYRKRPTDTPRLFHVATTWKQRFSNRFNVKYTWCVYWDSIKFRKSRFRISLRTEAATGGVLGKKVLLKILQNLQENTCIGVSFLIKLELY